MDVVRLWETVSQTAKTGTSGYQSAEEFNRDLAATQTSLLTLLSPLYAKDIAIQDMLSPFVRSSPYSANKPADYYQFISATVNGYPSYPIRPNQVSLYSTSPVRKPTASNNLSYYYFEDGQVKLLAPSGSTGMITYISYPTNASIVLNHVSDVDRDYVVPSSSGSLQWPESAFNLLLYMMVDRLGISMKENLLLEFSSLGIQMEASKL